MTVLVAITFQVVAVIAITALAAAVILDLFRPRA